MAETPDLLGDYKKPHELFANSSFDEDEPIVASQILNVGHNCHDCVPAHTGIAKRMEMDHVITNALRNETVVPNARMEALPDCTLGTVCTRGSVDDAKVKAFLDAGFTKRQILEVVLGAAQEVVSNYTNHLAETPVDKPFEKFEWPQPV